MSSFRVTNNIMALNALRNVGRVNADFSKSITRLSTGLRINSAADDPAGLIFSENFRAQIAGVNAAIKNNQDALNYAKTAEGALDEIGTLLKEGRTLAIASANVGALTSSQLQSNQTQWNLIANSISRIAGQTQFGTKRLLDGSAGVNAHVVSGNLLRSISLSGGMGDQSISASAAVSVQVTTAAAKASTVGTRTVAAADVTAYLSTAVGSAAGSFNINGTTFTVAATDTWGSVIDRINQSSGMTGVVADAVGTTDFSIRLTSQRFGTNARIQLVESSGVLQAASGSLEVTGVDAVASVTVGTLNPVTFTGGRMGNDGLTLTDASGNRVVLAEAGNIIANHVNAAQVNVGSVQFQIGGNAGQTAMLSLANFSASALGVNALDMTSGPGSQDAIRAIDYAIEEVSRRRGEIGSFMRNSLESNIRALGVARESLAATESNVRDTDMAEEMTNFTKLQILQQSGLTVLAQANRAPQGVLSLMQG